MRIWGWISNNDFSFHRLTTVVEKDMGEYAGKSLVRTWIQVLGLIGKKREVQTPDPRAQYRSCNTGNASGHRQWGLPGRHSSAEDTEAQEDSFLFNKHFLTSRYKQAVSGTGDIRSEKRKKQTLLWKFQKGAWLYWHLAFSCETSKQRLWTSNLQKLRQYVCDKLLYLWWFVTEVIGNQNP